MQKRIAYIALSLFSAAIMGCQKSINLNLPTPAPEIVVEGHIENGKTAYIILSRNAAFFSSFTPADISGSFVHGAVISVSDGSKTDTLKELSYDTSGVIVYIYNDLNFPNPIIGQVGKSYALDIKVNGQHLTAVTTIPQLTPLDSIWTQAAQTDRFNNDSLAILMAQYKSPQNVNVFVRYFTEVNHQGFVSDYNSVFNNLVVYGKTFNFPLNSGINTLDTSLNRYYPYFVIGDTITVKWCNIDQAQYNFWNTLDYNGDNEVNPFASPVVVASNINGGLGIWGGYGATYKTIVVPK